MEKYLEFKDEDSNKFWEISVSGSQHTVRFGKIGTNGTGKRKEFGSETEALQDAEKLIQSKIKKGYREVNDNHPSEQPETKAASGKNNLSFMTEEAFFKLLSFHGYSGGDPQEYIEIVRVDDLTDDASILETTKEIYGIDFNDAIRKDYYLKLAFVDKNKNYLDEEDFFNHAVTLEGGAKEVAAFIRSFLSYDSARDDENYYYDADVSALGYAMRALINHDLQYLDLAMAYINNIDNWEDDSYCANILIPDIAAKLGEDAKKLDFYLTVNLAGWTQFPGDFFLSKLEKGQELHEWIKDPENQKYVLEFIKKFDYEKLRIDPDRDYIEGLAEEIKQKIKWIKRIAETPKDLIIREGTTEIKKGKYQGMGIESVVIPKSVIIIHIRAFENNELTEVEIPDSVREIGFAAFSQNKLKTLVIPESVTLIDSHAFSGNELTSIIIPDNIEIETDAFSINRLTNVEIPASLTTIPLRIFERNELTSVIIPDGVDWIRSSAFGQNKLTSIVLPDSLETIDDHAFTQNLLTEITIPNSVTELSGFDNNKLTSIAIPDNVEVIGTSAFENNFLETVSIPDGVREIGYKSFKNNNLTSITIPASVETIVWGAFADNKITSVTIEGDPKRFNDIWVRTGISEELKPK